ncbi:anti-phage ZorAB system protein ZorA [Vibrio sp. SCSIO 43136]|uniref:anti-phage ZorAB system protein ZorA n=1 Tax=Vibrio sp. SCSIO 43136 TaxID=2819101 RepID=UPI0020750C67|nr:anti-phage ZorAB system protein ZorA [Vibrio sp. SCSIO 43136]USD63940.1 anti-phage defense ZorAB system ZorA [Vibrio sp. SCSIO 43136]
MQDTLNLSSLLPSLSELTISPQTPEQLSALFVVILWFVALVFASISAWAFHKSLSRVKWVNQLLESIDNNSPVNVRQELIHTAENHKELEGDLWLEFDETLIEVRGADDVIRLHNTFDGDYFFNTSTLAGGTTENRMIAAVPGFLTALGVIGTFVGLQLGLADLNIGGNVDVNEMKNGVAGVINGAKIAFMTSVWGVFLSVIFNFYEKTLEQVIRGKIKRLQSRIDRLFPRLSAEDQLQNIANNTQQSRESLQGLAEKIGDKMQESLMTATQGIQQGLEASLEKIMAPAINKLVDETSDGNQKALESVLQSFMDGFGQQGEQQRVAMDSASQNVNSTLEKMSLSMEAFVNKLELQQTASTEREKELISSISAQVSELVDSSNTQKRMLTEFMETQVSEMGKQLEMRETAAAKREQNLASAMGDTIDGLVDNVSEQSKVLTNFVTTQVTELTNVLAERDAQSLVLDQKRNESIAEQSKVFTDFVNGQMAELTGAFTKRDELSLEIDRKRNESFTKHTEAMTQGTEALLAEVNATSDAQMAAAKAIIEQGKQLQDGLKSSVTATAEATASMNSSAKELRSAADSMNVFGTNIKEAGNKLSGAVAEAVHSTKDLAEQNQLSSVKIESLREQLLEDTAKFSEIGDNIKMMLDTADTSFTSLKSTQSEFLKEQQSVLESLTSEMKRNVSELTDEMAQLLQDYAERANGQTANHLKVWATSTTQYAEQMNLAVQAISSVVDEIQGKVA